MTTDPMTTDRDRRHEPWHGAATGNPNAIAVVGLACRYGPADSAEALWALLSGGRSGIRGYTAEELIELGHHPGTLRRPGFVPAGCVLDDADVFDAAFFGYSAQHARWLDPQQRLLLETTWHAFEDACLPPQGGGLRTGVFMSVGQPTVPPVAITDLDAAGMIRFSSSDKDFAATRVSFKLGLTGPSMTVQTACSSSLVGVHLAVESLLGEECDLAVVGGVSLHHPQAGYVAGRDLIFSPSGSCRPFDATGDGTVFGNGVGVVVLRRLADAVAAGDPVRAVILGSAVNNDGAGKMDYHAPSPQGQEAVVREALYLAGVSAHTVGYVEAHGTATRLGDAVEFSALARVYGGADRVGPCHVGSVKNTIGHTNTAAGVAGLIKAVLLLEHGSVPGQHDFHGPNPTLPIDGSSLVVGLGSDRWPVDGSPRRAAVSSFGIGGTNAHLVLEQAPARPRASRETGGPYLVVVSARTTTARDLLAARLQRVRGGRGSLGRGVGDLVRDAASRERLAVVVHLAAAAVALRGGGVRTGTTGNGPEAGTAAVPGGDLAEIARAWVTGAGGLPTVDPAAGLVRLPRYPFARDRWPRPPVAQPAEPPLPAMLGGRVTEAATMCFERVVEPTDPLVAEHLVGGEPVLPAAAQLDMALSAVAHGPVRAVRALTDVTFHRPVRVGGPTRLLAEVGPARVRIFTEAGGERVLHCEAGVEPPSPAPPPPWPCPAETAATGGQAMADLYRRFADGGVSYGPAFQVIEELAGTGTEVVATVVSTDGGDHLVSPYLLDGVLQTVVGCWAGAETGDATYVPFSIERLEITGRVPERVRVQVRRLPATGSGRVRRFDLQAGGAGGVAVDVRGLALLPIAGRAPTLAGAAGVAGVPTAAGAPTLAGAPGVAARGALPEGVHLFRTGTVTAQRVDGGPHGPVVLLGDDRRRAAVLAKAFGVPAVAGSVAELPDEPRHAPVVVWPLPVADGVVACRDQALALLATVTAGLRSWQRHGVHLVVPYPAGAVAGPAVAALGRSLAAEHPRCALTAVELAEPGRDLVAAVLAAVATRPASCHLLAGGQTTTLVPLDPPQPTRAAFTEGGRYWINGMGALAEVLAGHLLDRYRARLLLTGRSAARGERARALRRLLGRGGGVEYHQLDCADPVAVRALVSRTEPVLGVLHCAGVLRDAPLATKTARTAAEVIDPKLLGAGVLDEATAHWPLEHFVIFSSVSGTLPSPGQGDYAFANAAVDEFARQRARRGPGRTMSVAWPLWDGAGIAAGTGAAEAIGAYGMRPLPPRHGVAVLETLLASERAPVVPVVLFGDRRRLEATLPLAGRAEPGVPAVDVASAPTGGNVEDRLVRLVAEITGTPVDRVRPEDRFEDLGVDSLLAVRIVDGLEPDFGRLARTLLFECHTTAELAGYLRAQFPDRCAALERPHAPAPAPAVGAATARAVGPDAGTGDDPCTGNQDPAAVDPGAIAIIGMAGRYPGGDGLDDLWQRLLAGDDLVTEIPVERWDAGELYHPERGRPGSASSRWGSFLDGVERFDARLFAMSPREASVTDPQARLFLETCWSVLENAGYRPDRLAGGDDPTRRNDVGVFVGVMYGEYQLHEAEERLRGNPVLANSAYWSIANRVSYFFDFQGPSLAVDTACSSALTAMHLACESLRAGGCSVAIAGGVNVLLHPNKYLMLSQGRFVSSDGRCRSFGAGGDGYVPGEGVGGVLLKPLARALADGDNIHGVIRGSAVNHGGRANGYTVPNPKAQAAVVTRAWRAAGLPPEAVDYVEAHGTGTALGDPIEIRGLTMALGGDSGAPCGSVPIGSVKSNLGHLEAAAGVVAVQKVLLQLRHRTLGRRSTRPHSGDRLAGSPLVVPLGVAVWGSPTGAPRRAGVNSFGAGGANAHLVIEEPPRRPVPGGDGAGPVVVFLSALTTTALTRYAADLAGRVRAERPRLADVAFTFAVGRVELARRRAVPAATLDELIAGLESVAGGGRLAAGDEVAGWEDGGRLDLVAACLAGDRGRRIPLPNYPFERVRCCTTFRSSASPAAATRLSRWIALASRLRPSAR
jgi:acyl transferase domain-containing protein/acyl carrier protein